MPPKNNKLSETPVVQSNKKATKVEKEPKIIEASESESEEECICSDNENEDRDEEDVKDDGEEEDSDSESESESEEEDETSKKIKEKKAKESFNELCEKMEIVRSELKGKNKEISEITKELKSKEKEKNDLERQLSNILKILSKTHIDEINKVKKDKPKRKGNVNGGFNKEHLIPEKLGKFLGIAPDVMMARPKVTSALHNKFTELKLKQGQNTTLDEATVKKLGLDKEYIGKIIKFTEFQKFLASFYPKKVEVTI